MRKFFILLHMALLCSVMSYAQSRMVTGQVKDESGKPVPFASVAVRDPVSGVATGGTSADVNGFFRIDVGTGKVLVISSAGFAAKEVAVTSGSNNYNIQLGNSAQVISEVVVTALGIRRNKNQLPYAAQQISGEEVSQSRSGNFISSMSGKVSGVEIRQGNAMGASTNIVIRGTKSLTKNNQAMFVVDGVPIDNSNTNSSGSSDPLRDQQRGRGGFDYGNAAADINPDDIESVTVLKGAAATALYGSRAANGVVMITTKKGKRGLGVTVNSGVTVGKIDKTTYAKYQKEYGAGYATAGYGSPDGAFFYFDVNGDGVKDRVTPTTEDASYGAKFDPNVMVYQWDAFDRTSPNFQKARPWVAAANDPTSFFETAFSTINSVVLDGGSDKGNFKLGYTRNEEKGIMPNSKLTKNILNFGSSYNLTEKLIAAATINFSRVQGRGRYGTGYDDWNVNQSFRQWNQANVDFREQKDAYFRSRQNMTWNWAEPDKESGLFPIYTDNPYWNRYENYQNDNRYRYFGNASLTYNPVDWLNILGRVSLDSYDEQQEERVAVGSHDPSFYGRFNRTFREYNYDLLANFNKNITTDFNIKALAGINIRRTTINALYAATNGGLVVPNLYSLSNSLNPIKAPDENADQIATDGYFGGITLGYKEFLTLEGTGRIDRSSTLPVDKNSYFYPSVSASFLFSKLLAGTAWLSSGKLRANYAEVGNGAPFASLADIYDKPTPFASAQLFSLPNTKNNPELKEERTKSKEVGLEVAFLNNRIGFDVSYYSTKSVDQIIPVSVSASTGYSFKFVNAGVIQNRGVELSMFITPVKTRDFLWNMSINWTRNRNEVLSLFDNSKNLLIGSGEFQGGVSVNATVGQPYGTIQGKTWVRHENGEKLVGENGYYVQTTTTNNVLGNINPDWIGGVYNTFKYKNISLGFLIDVRKGGDIFSLDMYYGMATGVYPESVIRNDLGNPSRNSLAEGGGIIMPGVTADGKPNTKRVRNDYGIFGYARNPAAAFVYDASYVKLRELVLTYALPQSIAGRLAPFKGISLSVIGRNLWIIHKNLPYADPEENLSSGNAQGYQSGAYPTTRTIGANLKFTF